MLDQLEREACSRNLLLRLQVGRPLGLWSLRLVVARSSGERLQLLGEMKAWAYGRAGGLQLDTLRVLPGAPAGCAVAGDQQDGFDPGREPQGSRRRDRRDADPAHLLSGSEPGPRGDSSEAPRGHFHFISGEIVQELRELLI